MTTADVRRIVSEAEAIVPEPPRPLRRELPPAELFPLTALGPTLGAAARAIEERVQAPPAICAQAVLATATLAVQAHADVALPYGATRPLSAYFVSDAASGERKTSADAMALSPVRDFEDELRVAYAADRRAHENTRACYEAERRDILAAKGDTLHGREQALAELAPPPAPPLTPMLTAPEPTYEGLVRLFAEGRPSLGLFASEGGQFIGGFGMSADHRLKTAAALSSLWDGEPIRRVRAGDGASVLSGRRLAMHLMLQPNVATGLLGDRLLAGQGLLSRLLVAAPDSMMGSRLWREPSRESAAALARYNARMAETLRVPLPLREGTANDLAPRPLTLSSSARAQWIAFADHVEGQLGPDGELAPIGAFAAKLPEHAARLGGILALVDDLGAAQLDAEHLAAGIMLAQHYASEALRLHDAAITSPDLLRAEALLRWLRYSWREPVVGLPDIYQRGPHAIRDARSAAEAVALLVDHGWVTPVEGGATVRGVRRREAWSLAPEVRS